PPSQRPSFPTRRSSDLLVNNASIFEIGGPLDADEATWDAHFNINLKAPFFLCQAFARRLPQDTPGNIINLLDWRIDRPRADRVVDRKSTRLNSSHVKIS